jgi:hypothetical protein
MDGKIKKLGVAAQVQLVIFHFEPAKAIHDERSM